MVDLKSSLQRTWKEAALNAQHIDGVYTLFEKFYGETHRAYHSLPHIAHCLQELEWARREGLGQGAYTIDLAIWFHDLVYDPRSKENENVSALMATGILTMAGAANWVIQPVANMVRATAHTRQAIVNNPSLELLLDIDLAILGRPRDEFEHYERGIRHEYAFVDNATFCSVRAAILEGFLDGQRLYYTDFFENRYGARARANLTDSVERLHAGRILSFNENW